MSTTTLSDAHYKRAKRDPIARLVLDALHKQDAATWNGSAGDIGALALQTAAKIRSMQTKQARRAAAPATGDAQRRELERNLNADPDFLRELRGGRAGATGDAQ